MKWHTCLNEIHVFFGGTFFFFWLALVDIYFLEFTSPHIKDIMYANLNSKENRSWSKNKCFHLFVILMLKNFFNVKLKYEQFLISLSFMGTPFRSSGPEVCNFIEITLQHGCSIVNLLHIFRTLFSKNTSERLLLYFRSK